MAMVTATTQQRMADAEELIEIACHLPLDLGRLARHAGYSRWHFVRAFRRQFDITPYQYLIRRRIEKSKALLSYSEIPLTEGCLSVGFQRLGTLSALFHRIVGCIPTAHRLNTHA